MISMSIGRYIIKCRTGAGSLSRARGSEIRSDKRFASALFSQLDKRQHVLTLRSPSMGINDQNAKWPPGVHLATNLCLGDIIEKGIKCAATKTVATSEGLWPSIRTLPVNG